MSRINSAALLAFFLVCSATRSAQQPQNPPAILKLTHVVVSPGKEAPFARVSAERSQYLATIAWPTISIALTPVTGPNEVLFLSGYKSLEEWAHDRAMENSPEIKSRLNDLTARAGELIASRRDISADFEPEISYRASYDWSKIRYVDLITILLRPGRGDEYLKNRNIVLEAHKKAAVDEHMMIYQISSGYPGTTFLILRPVETFNGLDLEKQHGDRYMKVLGEENRKELHDLFAASVQTQEEEFYAVDPAMSYVTASWAGSDKQFWLGHQN
ncbi:MAG: hypothetical protein JOZ62_10870 [Acidobacteriaceae bacterium]|nr:hypothetical protein [Acidobacteriaceae bacterium]